MAAMAKLVAIAPLPASSAFFQGPMEKSPDFDMRLLAMIESVGGSRKQRMSRTMMMAMARAGPLAFLSSLLLLCAFFSFLPHEARASSADVTKDVKTARPAADGISASM